MVESISPPSWGVLYWNQPCLSVCMSGFIQSIFSEPLNLLWPNLVWWCLIMGWSVMWNNADCFFKVKVTVRWQTLFKNENCNLSWGTSEWSWLYHYHCRELSCTLNAPSYAWTLKLGQQAVCGYACSNWLVGGRVCGHGELCHVDECGLHGTDWKADLHRAFCTLFPVQRRIVDIL